MKIVRLRKSPAAFDAAVASRSEAHFYKLPYAHYGREYYRAIHGDALDDHSFLLEHGNEVICVVECDRAGGALGRFGFPIEFCMRPDWPLDLKRRLVAETTAELRRLSAEAAVETIVLRSAAAIDPEGILLGDLMQLGARPALEFRSVVDLSLSETEIFNDLRKGHRQQVKWGEANLAYKFVDRDHPDLDLFERYRAFHADVAGRQTRREESWRAMFSAIAAGYGDLVLGYLDNDLVSGSLILDGQDVAYYASGVYRRELFDKPLGHAPLFSAILRAKARKLKGFDIGEIAHQGSDASDKERAIGYFKRGFTSSTDTSIRLTWRVAA